MKQFLKKWMALVAIACIVNSAAAQQSSKSETAPWASDKGYWVIETNVKTPLQHKILFYTLDDVLVYTEAIDGIRLNADKRKVKMKLKQVLETAITAWQQNKTPEADKEYVAMKLRTI